VARLALHRNVGTCQREIRGSMIKCRPTPIDRTMALLAIMAEIPRHMIRVRRSVEIRCMTLIAIGVCQLVVSIHMTGLTLGCNVSAGQWEVCGVMIKCGCIPIGR